MIKKSTLDESIMNRLIRQYDRLTHYHIHPYTVFDKEKDKQDFIKWATKFVKKNLSKERLDQFVQNGNGGQTAFPSSNDLATMVSWSKNFYAVHPTGDITFKIVSPYGITEYKVTEKGKELFALNLPTIQQLMQINHRLTNSYLTRFTTGGYSALLQEWVVEQIGETCQDMSTSHYTVHFTPFKVEKNDNSDTKKLSNSKRKKSINPLE